MPRERRTAPGLGSASRTCLIAWLAALAFAGSASGQLPGEPVHTVEFYSPAVDRTMKYNIVLPYGYEESDIDYPVLYLLHGVSQNVTQNG